MYYIYNISHNFGSITGFCEQYLDFSKAFIKEQPKGLSTNAIKENLNKEINVGPWDPPPTPVFWAESSRCR